MIFVIFYFFAQQAVGMSENRKIRAADASRLWPRKMKSLDRVSRKSRRRTSLSDGWRLENVLIEPRKRLMMMSIWRMSKKQRMRRVHWEKLPSQYESSLGQLLTQMRLWEALSRFHLLLLRGKTKNFFPHQKASKRNRSRRNPNGI